MEVLSMQNLCEILIYHSIQRCRQQDDLCRLSVTLKPYNESNRTLTRVSVSDTGIGSTFEEFQDLKYSNTSILANIWDGMISISTTNFTDNELHHININTKEVSSSLNRLTKLPSSPKHNAKFSGTEVSLLTSESINTLLPVISLFLQKMLIFKYPKVAIELLVHSGTRTTPEYDTCVLAIECNSSPSESMKLGLENYILKHGKYGNSICDSCFSNRELLKVGSGNQQSKGLNIEAIIVISETSESCRTFNNKTEILYFEDFTPCSVSDISMDVLKNIKWKSYGLTFKTIFKQDGFTFIEWENLSPQVNIHISLHTYSKKYKKVNNSQLIRKLTKKAVVNALKELKEQNGVLLSEHAVKICNYAPELAKSISRLVMCSNDVNFKGECCAILGMDYEEMEINGVENCIKEKIMYAIGLNDREVKRNKDLKNVLFEDDLFQRFEFMDEDYYQGEEEFSSLDL